MVAQRDAHLTRIARGRVVGGFCATGRGTPSAAHADLHAGRRGRASSWTTRRGAVGRRGTTGSARPDGVASLAVLALVGGAPRGVAVAKVRFGGFTDTAGAATGLLPACWYASSRGRTESSMPSYLLTSARQLRKTHRGSRRLDCASYNRQSGCANTAVKASRQSHDSNKKHKLAANYNHAALGLDDACPRRSAG